MDLNELVTIWKGADQELEEKLRVNRALFKEVSVNKIRSLMGEFKWARIIEILFNILFLIFLTGFIIDHFSIPKFSVPAAALIGLMIYGLGFNIYSLKLFYRIDVKSSVLQTQEIVERVKYYQVLNTKMLYVLIPLFSAPFLIVLVKAILDFDIYVLGNWLIYYMVGSVMVALVVVIFLRKFPDKNMEKVLAFLSEIRNFEKEEGKG
jgi:glucan phosphoethanolaminetransferase (alkaline phosphatase superfamily)